MFQTEEMLRALTAIPSVSGQEGRGKDALCQLLTPYFDEYREDPSGTHLFIRRCGRPDAKRLLLDAHFDEIGMLVSDITEEGFLRVAPVGGLDRRVLAASEVQIYGKETLYGVIAATPPHLQGPDDYKKAPKISELLIDTGYSQKDLETLCPVGTPVGFYEKPERLRGGVIAGRGMDNKACCTAAVRAAALTSREALVCDVYVCLSSREEASLSDGCSAAAYRLRPDAAIVTDVTFATSPGVPEDESGKRGGGPVLSLSAVTDRRLTRRLLQLCEENGIPHTTCVDAADTGTNATLLSMTGDGIVTAVVSVPITSMHTYNETVDLADIEAAADLFSAAMRDPQLFKTGGACI